MDIVKLDWNGMIPDVHCPVCGKTWWAQDVEFESCEHLLFGYVIEAGCFEYITDEFQDFIETEAKNIIATMRINIPKENVEDELNLEEIDIEDELDCELLEQVLEKYNSSSAFTLSLTTNGIACGPISSTLYVGIDFCPDKN